MRKITKAKVFAKLWVDPFTGRPPPLIQTSPERDSRGHFVGPVRKTKFRGRIREFKAALAIGKLPRPDTTKSFIDPIEPSRSIHVYYWRVEGVANHNITTDLLIQLSRDYENKGKDILTRFAVVAGKGKDERHIGSQYRKPKQTLTYSLIWQQRPSAKPLLEGVEAGDKIYYEVEAQVREPYNFEKPKRKRKSKAKVSRKRQPKAKAGKKRKPIKRKKR